MKTTNESLVIERPEYPACYASMALTSHIWIQSREVRGEGVLLIDKPIAETR